MSTVRMESEETGAVFLFFGGVRAAAVIKRLLWIQRNAELQNRLHLPPCRVEFYRMKRDMKLYLASVLVFAVVTSLNASEKPQLPTGLPKTAQKLVNIQRRFALAGLDRFTVTAMFISPSYGEKERDDAQAALLDFVARTLRAAEVPIVNFDEVGDNWSKTGQLLCSVSYSPFDDLLQISVELSAEMVNPRTSKSDLMTVWRYSEEEISHGPKGIPVDKVKAALQSFIIDYITANQSSKE